MSLDLIIVIPARGGSQRVPRKNLAVLGGRPLIDYSFDLLRKTNLTKRAWISTEDEEIAAHTRAAGLQVIDRPAELAGYDTPTEAVLLHALDTLEHQPDWIMTLQPTNPFRTQETLLKVIAAAESAPDTVDCILTVTPTLGDFWRKEAGQLQRLFPDAPRSQQARQAAGLGLLEENSAIYLTRTQALLHAETGNSIAPILGRAVHGVEIGRKEAWDINTPEDLRLAEAMLKPRANAATKRDPASGHRAKSWHPQPD
jgi:CMP-N,N'-diacetyllegionaminic acid synthase